MKRFEATIDIDVQDAFDDLIDKEQRNFLKENIGVLSDVDLIDELEYRGYNVQTIYKPKKNDNTDCNND